MSGTELIRRLEVALRCPICRSALEPNVSRLPCHHYFCAGCIREELQSRSACPVCGTRALPRSVAADATMRRVVEARRRLEREGWEPLGAAVEGGARGGEAADAGRGDDGVAAGEAARVASEGGRGANGSPGSAPEPARSPPSGAGGPSPRDVSPSNGDEAAGALTPPVILGSPDEGEGGSETGGSGEPGPAHGSTPPAAEPGTTLGSSSSFATSPLAPAAASPQVRAGDRARPPDAASSRHLSSPVPRAGPAASPGAAPRRPPSLARGGRARSAGEVRNPRPLRDWTLYVSGRFKGRDEASSAAVEAGARLLARLPAWKRPPLDFDPRNTAVVVEDAADPGVRAWCQRWGVALVRPSWIFDSAAAGKPRPRGGYAVGEGGGTATSPRDTPR